MARRALYGFDPTRLIEVRRERGLSRSDLGRIADVPYNTLRRWETANAAPAPELLKQVADALGVELSELAVIPTAAATLASRRNEKGLTQLEVATALGMSKSTYSRLERGERKATRTTFVDSPRRWRKRTLRSASCGRGPIRDRA